MASVQSSSRAIQIQTKKQQLQKVTEEIRVLDSQAKTKNLELKKQKESQTANRLSKSRILMHNNATKNDRVLRPCDRGNDIRTYSKMDLDVWQYPQVGAALTHALIYSHADPFVAHPLFNVSASSLIHPSNLYLSTNACLQVREWFNEGGQPAPHQHESPAETGYMISK